MQTVRGTYLLGENTTILAKTIFLNFVVLFMKYALKIRNAGYFDLDDKIFWKINVRSAVNFSVISAFSALCIMRRFTTFRPQLIISLMEKPFKYFSLKMKFRWKALRFLSDFMLCS